MESKSSEGTKNWEETFFLVAGCLREEFKHQYSFTDDGDVSPSILALRDAFHRFPVSTDVLLIDAGTVRALPHPATSFLAADMCAGPIWTLIAHHLVDDSAKSVTFHGTRSLKDLEHYLTLLADRFDLADESYADSIKRLTFTGCWTWDSSHIVDFVPFDIRDHAATYGRYLAQNLFVSHGNALVQRFKKETDFNALYAMQTDAIRPRRNGRR
jgi:hypothetical protein